MRAITDKQPCPDKSRPSDMEDMGTDTGLTVDEQKVMDVFSINRRMTEPYVRTLSKLSKLATFKALNGLRVLGRLKRIPTRYVPNKRIVDTYELV